MATQESQKSARGSERDGDEGHHEKKLLESESQGNQFHHGELTRHTLRASTSGATSRFP